MATIEDAKNLDLEYGDVIIRAVSNDNYVKISAISAKNIVEHARQIHDTAPTSTAALGRSLAAVSMLGERLKGDNDSVTLRINGGGEIGSIVCVSDSVGNVRGYAQNPDADPPRKPNGKLDVGAAVGTDGMLTVSRDFGLKEPYIGSTQLVSGEIAEDLTAYLTESEQIGSAVALGVLVASDKSCIAAGGYIVQLMPDAPDDHITRLETNIQRAGYVTDTLKDGSIEDIIEKVLEGFSPRILERVPVEYRCTCSRERISRALSSISAADLAEIIESDEATEVSCQFCSAIYGFTPEEMETIAREASFQLD